jgi:hypothetical protein
MLLIARFSSEEVSTGGIQSLRRNIIPDLAELVRKHGKPIVFSLMAPSEVRIRARYTVDFPIFDDAEEAVNAAAVLRDYSLQREEKGR